MSTEEYLMDRKRELHELIDSTEDEALLDQVYEILNQSSDVWWDEETERESIEAAEADIAAGRVLTHDQVLENIKSWRRK